MQKTTLAAQSQMIKKWSLVRSFLWMLSPAHKLIAKVTTVIEMFANRKTLSLVAFTWNTATILLLSSRTIDRGNLAAVNELER